MNAPNAPDDPLIQSASFQVSNSSGPVIRAKETSVCIAWYVRLLVVLLFVAIVGNTVLLVWHASSALNSLADLKRFATEWEAGRRGMQDPDVTGIRTTLLQASQELAAVRRHAAPFLVLSSYLSWFPKYGGDIAAAPHLLEVGQALTDAGLMLLDALAPLFEGHFGDRAEGQDSLLPVMLTVFSDATSQLAQAEVYLYRAEVEWEQVRMEQLTPWLAEQIAPLAHYLPLLRTAVHLAIVAPPLLGADGPRRYLILAQNEDELRPTGGFISAAGLVTLERGRITQLEFRDSYEVDDLSKPYPEPPDPLRRYMLAELWLFRDVNWSPDFLTAARIAADFYAYGRGVSVDGVVAIDQKALQYLLDGLGPVVIATSKEMIRADNVIEAVRAHWAPLPEQGLTEEWWQQRKLFLGDLADAIRHKIETASTSIDMLALIRALERTLDEKHLLIYSPQPEVAGVLNRAGWDGSVQPWEGDYLMVVDANVGFNKASALVTKRIEHTVTLDTFGGAEAQVSLTYRHSGDTQSECRPEIRYDPVYAQMMQRCLWNYMRLYLPIEATLVSMPQLIVPAEAVLSKEATNGEVDIEPAEGGKQSLGLLFVLPPRESTTLEYHYRLSDGLAAQRVAEDTWRYALLIQKQPGSEGTVVQISVQLPPSGRVVHSVPAPQMLNGDQLVYQTELQRDWRLLLTYALDRGRVRSEDIQQ
ncbi:MAG: DUF4012 domain-containing protein [Anaerolineae bacterium]